MRARGRSPAKECPNAPGILSIHLIRDIFPDQNQRRYKQMIDFIIAAVIEFVGEMVLEFFSWLRFRSRQLTLRRKVPLRRPENRVWLVLLAASALFLCAGHEIQVCNAQTKPIHPAGGISAGQSNTHSSTKIPQVTARGTKFFSPSRLSVSSLNGGAVSVLARYTP
jgi:hypothetical protein